MRSGTQTIVERRVDRMSRDFRKPGARWLVAIRDSEYMGPPVSPRHLERFLLADHLAFHHCGSRVRVLGLGPAEAVGRQASRRDVVLLCQGVLNGGGAALR